MNKFALGLLTSLFIMLAGCQSNKPLDNDNQGVTPSTMLTSTHWTLVQVNDIVINTVAEDKNNTPKKGMMLQIKDNRLTGFSGCNRFFGSFEAESPIEGLGKLKFKGIASTKMACANMAIKEQTYFNALNNTAFYKLSGSALTLFDESLTVLALFESNDE